MGVRENDRRDNSTSTAIVFQLFVLVGSACLTTALFLFAPVLALGEQGVSLQPIAGDLAVSVRRGRGGANQDTRIFSVLSAVLQ